MSTAASSNDGVVLSGETSALYARIMKDYESGRAVALPPVNFMIQTRRLCSRVIAGTIDPDEFYAVFSGILRHNLSSTADLSIKHHYTSAAMLFNEYVTCAQCEKRELLMRLLEHVVHAAAVACGFMGSGGSARDMPALAPRAPTSAPQERPMPAPPAVQRKRRVVPTDDNDDGESMGATTTTTTTAPVPALAPAAATAAAAITTTTTAGAQPVTPAVPVFPSRKLHRKTSIVLGSTASPKRRTLPASNDDDGDDDDNEDGGGGGGAREPEKRSRATDPRDLFGGGSAVPSGTQIRVRVQSYMNGEGLEQRAYNRMVSTRDERSEDPEIGKREQFMLYFSAIYIKMHANEVARLPTPDEAAALGDLYMEAFQQARLVVDSDSLMRFAPIQTFLTQLVSFRPEITHRGEFSQASLKRFEALKNNAEKAMTVALETFGAMLGYAPENPLLDIGGKSVGSAGTSAAALKVAAQTAAAAATTSSPTSATAATSAAATTAPAQKKRVSADKPSFLFGATPVPLLQHYFDEAVERERRGQPPFEQSLVAKLWTFFSGLLRIVHNTYVDFAAANASIPSAEMMRAVLDKIAQAEMTDGRFLQVNFDQAFGTNAYLETLSRFKEEVAVYVAAKAAFEQERARAAEIARSRGVAGEKLEETPSVRAAYAVTARAFSLLRGATQLLVARFLVYANPTAPPPSQEVIDAWTK